MDKSEGIKVNSTIEPYLQIESIGITLRLYDIDARQRIRLGAYDICVGDEWIRLDATEPYLSTSGRPIRAVELYGTESVAEQILHLESYLLKDSNLLQMKDATGEVFEVVLKSKWVRSSLYAAGIFLKKGDDEEFQCRFKLPERKEIIGSAIEAEYRDMRALSVRDLSFAAKIELIRAVLSGSIVLVEKIPWVA